MILVTWTNETSGPLTRGWIPNGLSYEDFAGYENETPNNQFVGRYKGSASTLDDYGLTEYAYPEIIETTGIRIITTGSMQSRFSIQEELLIQADPIANILTGRLFNSKYIDLDDDELTSGIAYIINYLDSVGGLFDGATPVERSDKLLEDGTTKEGFY